MASLPSVPTPEPDLVLEPPAGQPPKASNTGVLVVLVIVLVGILLTLVGILYVTIEHTGVFDTPPAEARCQVLDGEVVLSANGGEVCDLPPKTPAGERFGPEDFPMDEWAQAGDWSEKELHCRSIDGFVVWSTNGSKICDVPPRTLPGHNFGSEDWFIEYGEFVNPFGE